MLEHVEAKAQDRFGAQVPKKSRKNGPKAFNDDLKLDPETLELYPGQYKDANGKEVQIISFAEVTAEGRGIALCSVQQASHYLTSAQSISIDALALALIEPPPEEVLKNHSKLSKAVIPARYQGTGEPILLFGGLVQLGDVEVSRNIKKAITEIEAVSTAVIRAQAYKDLLLAEWDAFSAAPVRQMINWIPALKRCPQEECQAGQQPGCRFSHPAVDESYDQVVLDIWSRNSLRLKANDVVEKMLSVLQFSCGFPFPHWGRSWNNNQSEFS